jgi:hypothetical protein
MNDAFVLWWALVHTAGHPCGNSSLQFNSLQTLQKKYNKNSFPNLKIVKRKTPPKNCMI